MNDRTRFRPRSKPDLESEAAARLLLTNVTRSTTALLLVLTGAINDCILFAPPGD